MPFFWLDKDSHHQFDNKVFEFRKRFASYSPSQYGAFRNEALGILRSVEGKLLDAPDPDGSRTGRPSDGWEGQWLNYGYVITKYFGDRKNKEERLRYDAIIELVRFVKDVEWPEDEEGHARQLKQALTLYLRSRGYPPFGDQGEAEQEERWLTVTQAATVAGCDTGVISHEASRGNLRSNGKKRSERRIDGLSLIQWMLSKANKSEPQESDEAVERKNHQAASKA